MEGKLHVPGWRIEQRFNNNVLIGNWNEERRKFHKGGQPFGNSTHRIDFGNYGNYLPDKSTRRAASLKNEGLPKTYIFSHHGKCYSNNMISWYDQQMNKREQAESSLPKLRTWDSKTMAWLPEKTDHPLQGKSTTFGLHDKMKAKWSNDNKKERESNYSSTYMQSFNPHTKDAMVFHHYATKKPLSSHFHSHRINKDLPLRNSHVNIAPEFPPLAYPVK